MEAAISACFARMLIEEASYEYGVNKKKLAKACKKAQIKSGPIWRRQP